ncbi:MAG: glycine cleavage system protein GcvH [bacterium]|nr:glycine cleavage system protein GcvH [bacterium]
MIPNDLKYTNDHEWVRVNGDIAEVGITHFAQEQLGDIVFVEVPAVGTAVAAKDRLGVVESVKTVSDVFAPVSGEVVEINPLLVEDNDDFQPEIVNSDPFGEGWMVRLRMSKPEELSGLLSAEDYKIVTEEA